MGKKLTVGASFGSPQDYQAQDDANHLMRAQEVMSDPARHAKAKKHLSKMHKEKQGEAMNAKAAKGLSPAGPPC